MLILKKAGVLEGAMSWIVFQPAALTETKWDGEPPTTVSCAPRRMAFGSKLDILDWRRKCGAQVAGEDHGGEKSMSALSCANIFLARLYDYIGHFESAISSSFIVDSRTSMNLQMLVHCSSILRSSPKIPQRQSLMRTSARRKMLRCCPFPRTPVPEKAKYTIHQRHSVTQQSDDLRGHKIVHGVCRM